MVNPRAPLAIHLVTFLVLDKIGGRGLQPRASGDNSGCINPLIKCLDYVASEAADSYCAQLFTLTFTGYLRPISITWDFYRKLAVGIWPLQLPGNNLVWIVNSAWADSVTSQSVLRRICEELPSTAEKARNLFIQNDVIYLWEFCAIYIVAGKTLEMSFFIKIEAAFLKQQPVFS